MSGDVIGARANRRSVHVSLSSITRFLQLYVLAAAQAHGLYWHIRCSCLEKERKNQSNHYPTIMIQLNKFRCLVKVKDFGSLHTLRYFHVLYIILMYSQLTILAWFTVSAIHHLVNAYFHWENAAHTSYIHAGSLSYSHIIFVHQGPVTAW